MTIQALRDAFKAGYAYGFKAPDGMSADEAFERWYADVLEYLDREAMPSRRTQTNNAGLASFGETDT